MARRARNDALTPLPRRDVTELLLAWSDGDRAALEELVPLVHGELHRLAKRMMARERRDHTLHATALVNEAYLRLVDVHRVHWRNRVHFFAVSAQIMRRILVEFARSHHRHKRGGGVQPSRWRRPCTRRKGVSPATVMRDWNLAKVWLLRELRRT